MRIVLLLFTGLSIFAASAGVSWYLQQTPTAAASTKAPVPEPAPSQPAQSTELYSNRAEPGINQQLPVATRPRPMTVEEIVKYSLSLKKQEQALTEREQTLQQMEERQKLVRADIQMDQQQFTSMLSSVTAQQEAAKDLMKQVDEARIRLSEEQQAAETKKQLEEQARVVIEQEQRENIRQLSTWMQAMEPDKAGEVLKQFADDGRLEIAVQILANFEEREAAQILSSLQDPKLISQFVEAYRNMKQPQKSTNTRRR